MFQSDWWKKAVIYELYVDKFAGNFAGLTARLDYFTDLGVDTLWILPHYPSPMIDDGYDISDYRDIKPELGTMADFDNFVSLAHGKGLKVIIDIVLNHTSDQHPWFKEASSSKDNPKRNWYLWSDNQTLYKEAFIHFSQVKTSNWIFNPPTGDYYYATFYPQQPDLNWGNPDVVLAMYEIMDFWLAKGIDGFRLDAISRLIKRDGTNCFGLPETHEALKKIRAHIDAGFPGAVLLAESGGWPDEAKAFFGAGDECQLVINFPLAVRLLSSISTGNLPATGDLLTAVPDTCRWAVFLTNHDSVDLFFLTDDNEKIRFLDQVDPDKRYSYTGHHSLGARLGEVCKGEADKIIWATEKLLAQPGVPIIYYGNEIGMRNLDLSEKPKDVRLFVRGQFDWPEADKQRSDPGSLFNSVRTLLKNRQV